MNIQLALDRMTIPEAIDMAREVRDHVDWIEVGTSLIKEFGMDSVQALKREFPGKVIVADMKTFDNAKYEFELCFRAGADVATVMGAAPLVTVETCMKTAAMMGKTVMIDLLHVSPGQRCALSGFNQAVHCLHVSKDEQELSGHQLQGRGSLSGSSSSQAFLSEASLSEASLSETTEAAAGPKLAVAGGITLESLPELLPLAPHVIIIGSAITKAADPRQAALQFKQLISAQKERLVNG